MGPFENHLGFAGLVVIPRGKEVRSKKRQMTDEIKEEGWGEVRATTAQEV